MPPPLLRPPATDLLNAWTAESIPKRRIRGRTQAKPRGLRFAFYGRRSTAEYQDHASSRQWQYDSAEHLVARRGRIVVSFFDVGVSRSLPWAQRRQAAALLAAASDPDRVFDAIVIGEYERAFAGPQLQQLLPARTALGVQVWLPEADGPINPADPAHQALMMLLGHQSEREVLRCRFRTTHAMRAQARDQGRHLGGRPSYGYRLVDAGPHPNQAHARWGRRLHRLDPGPDTASRVQWIFARRLDGWSTSAIAARSTLRASPRRPATAGPATRTAPARSWGLRTVAAILANPRYTGRQVWNRQSIDHHEATPGDKASRIHRRKPTHHWNPREEWEISTRFANPPLVSEDDFLAAQQITAVDRPDDGNSHRYQLTGLVICGLCGRRTEGHWAHGRARYRCRHGHTSATDANPGRHKTLYVREDQVLTQATIQYANSTGLDPATLTADILAEALREQGITIVCTPVSITLDLPTAEAESAPTPTRTHPGNSLRAQPTTSQLSMTFSPARSR